MSNGRSKSASSVTFPIDTRRFRFRAGSGKCVFRFSLDPLGRRLSRHVQRRGHHGDAPARLDEPNRLHLEFERVARSRRLARLPDSVRRTDYSNCCLDLCGN